MKKIRKVKRIKRAVKKIRSKSKVGTSKVEKEFGVFLKNVVGVEIEQQFNIAYKFFDFRIKGTNILLEFQGSYWHCDKLIYKKGPINKIQKDAIKNDLYKKSLAEANGFKVIEVWESEFKISNRFKLIKKLKGLF